MQPDVSVYPLLPATDRPQILQGYAATTDVDRQRMKFQPYCFGYPLLSWKALPPLHARHDESKTVGSVDALTYDDKGNLTCRCTVVDPHARRLPAFSVGARVLDYELRDVDTPHYYALITHILHTLPAGREARETGQGTLFLGEVQAPDADAFNCLAIKKFEI